MCPQQEHQERVGIFPDRPADPALMKTRLFHALDGPAPGFALEQVDGDIECFIPGLGEGLILASDLIGVTAVQPRLAGGFADVSGFGESFQKLPLLAGPCCGFGHAFHPKKKAPCGVFPQSVTCHIIRHRITR